MPEYLNFDTKLADLDEAKVEEQLKVQIERVLEALSRLEDGERIDPRMLEQVVSV